MVFLYALGYKLSYSHIYKIKKQLPYGNRLFLLTCFTNSQSPDKEEGKSEQEDQTCNGKSFQPSWKVFLLFCNKYVIQKRKERCCKEWTNHGETKHGCYLTLEEENNDEDLMEQTLKLEPPYLLDYLQQASVNPF